MLELTGIAKSFGGVDALGGVDFLLRDGEIHGLVGENGAGKSTLMKILAGVHADYGGALSIDGVDRRFRSAREAREAGIGMVHQELSVVPELSVAENVFLGVQPVKRLGWVDWRRMAREASEHLSGLGILVDPEARMASLPIGLQQLVELARVLFSGARMIILDEPTSALSPPEVERLFQVLRRLKADGRSIIFISHFIDDVLRIADTVTVLRNGRKVVSAATSGIDKRWVIERMIGGGHEQLEESYTGEIRLESRPDAPVVLEARELGYGRLSRHQPRTSRRRSTRHLWLHGMRPARAGAEPLRQAAARARRALSRGQAAPPRQHRRGKPRRPRLRAGEPAQHAVRA